MGRLDSILDLVRGREERAARRFSLRSPVGFPAAGTELPAQLPGSWSTQFGIPGLDGEPQCATYYRGDLIVGGYIEVADGQHTRGIARWNGHAWHPMGYGLTGYVTALTVWNGRLVAGGYFSSGTISGSLAIWNGQVWEQFPGERIDGQVLALASDGSSLVAGGTFDHIGTLPTGNVARWDGATWDAMGGGTDGRVRAVARLADGWAVGGEFRLVGGAPAGHVAVWNGAAWDPLDRGITTANGGGAVLAMARLGDDLLIGGVFDSLGTVAADGIARWDGTGWHALPGAPENLVVTALETDGGIVHIGAIRLGVSFDDRSELATWNGSTYVGEVGSPVGEVTAIASAEGRVAVCGNFNNVDHSPVLCTAVRVGARWEPAEGWRPPMHGLSSFVQSLARFKGEVVALGGFRFAADDTGWVHVNGIARWDGARWRPMGDQAFFGATELLADGDALYATGYQSWRWDGTRWNPLGVTSSGPISHLASYKGELWGGGHCFGFCPDATALWRWDGQDWVPVQPPAGITPFDARVSALHVHGDRLVVAWAFYQPDGTPRARLVPWDGNGWGPDLGDFNGSIDRLVTFQGHLCAIGGFGQISHTPVYGFAILEDTGWDAHGYEGSLPYAIAASDSALFVGSNAISAWDGARWRMLGSVRGDVGTILADDQSLWVGGGFRFADETGSHSIARFDFETSPPPHSDEGLALTAGPNPSRDVFSLTFTLPEAAPVRLVIHDLMGREVRLLLDQILPAGSHTVTWDTLDRNGRAARLGLYFARLEPGQRHATTRTIALVR